MPQSRLAVSGLENATGLLGLVMPRARVNGFYVAW